MGEPGPVEETNQVSQLARQGIATVIFERRGLLCIYFLYKRRTINAECYCQVLSDESWHTAANDVTYL